MNNWKNIKWIFETDGSLRDIYVQEVSISDWRKIIDFLNENYDLKYGPSDKNKNQIDKKYIIKYLTDKTGEMDLRTVSIDLKGIITNCHFFLTDQIEFDIDPKEVTTTDDAEKVIEFMKSISELLQTQVTLTAENNIEFPLIKVDIVKGIEKILTVQEAQKLYRKENKLTNKISRLKTEIRMKFSPDKFKQKILDSANQEYKPTKKENNVW